MKLNRTLVVLLIATGIVGGDASAETYTFSWASGSDLREVMTPGGPTLRVSHGVLTPQLPWPCRIARIEIPGDARVTSARLVVLNEERQPRASNGYAVPEADVDFGPPDIVDEGYALWVLPEGDLLGSRIAHVAICPFRADDDALLYLSEFNLELETGPNETVAARRRVVHPRTERADAKTIRGLLDAPSRVLCFPDDSRPLDIPPEMSPETTELVIITSEDFTTPFEELADIRTKEGIPAKVTTVEWILSNYDGIDMQARIRSYIRDLYLYQGLRYVLIGGDTDRVPVRLVLSRFQVNPFVGLDILTDLYYACLDGNWNADGDSDVGEAPYVDLGWEGDHADLYQEVSVSRVPCSSLAEATTFVTKWKSYTGNDPANFRNDYQTKILSLGEVLFPDDWTPGDDPGSIVQDGADFCESTLVFIPPGFESTRLYQYSENPDYPDAEPEIKDSVVVRLNEGYGIVDHVGHGYRTNMSVGDDRLINQDVDAFMNTNAYSLLYAINCSSGALLYDCIVEHFLGNPNGGAIASVAATDLDYPLNSTRFKTGFFSSLFVDDVTALADAQRAAYLPHVPTAMSDDNVYRWTMTSLTIIGDPSMEIWRDHPDTLEISAPPTMVLGDGSLAVTITDDGAPVEDARVCLWKEDGYGVGFTNASGVATIDFLPDSEGTFRITATSNSYVPTVETAEVLSPTTAALRVDAWVSHDGTGPGGSGNADNRPDAGESIVIELTLRNDGSVTATGVEAVFHANSPFLTVSDSTVTAGDIPPGGSGVLPTAFSFSVDANLPDTLRHVTADATVELRSDQGTWFEPWPSNFYQRILDLTRLDWTIGGDDGDSVLEAGETADVTITVGNWGEGFSPDVVGVGTTESSGFMFLQDTIEFGDVASGAEIQGGMLSVLSLGGGAEELAIDFTVSDDISPTLLTRRLDLIPPTPLDTLAAAPGTTSIALSWTQITDPDLRGYRVYRSDTWDGVYTEITPRIIEAGSFYADEGLSPLTEFFYRAASIDSSGNASDLSTWISATTSPANLEGWPVGLPLGGNSRGSPTFANLDEDPVLEIVLGWNYPLVFRADGGDFVDGDNDPFTDGIFSTIESGISKFWNSPAVFDLDEDTVAEIVFSAWQTTDYAHLYVLDATGAVEDGWPQVIGNTPWPTPAVGDVDGDGDLELFTSSGSGSEPYRGVLFGFHHDGSEIIDGDNDPTTHGVFYKSASSEARFMYGSPAMADIDGDTLDEIVFFEKTRHSTPSEGALYVFDGNGDTLDGFPYSFVGLRGSTSSPAVADLDQNGDLEIVAVTDKQVIVVNHDGSEFNGWPQEIGEVSSSSIRDMLSSPAIGDVNGDGDLDIALGWLWGKLYVWTADGGLLHDNFPATIVDQGASFTQYVRSPVLGNIDGDPLPEIIVSSGDAKLHAINHDGSAAQGFPLQLDALIYGSVAMWDIDMDGNMIVQTEAPELRVYDFPGVPFVGSENPWPMFRHDIRKSGWLETPIIIDVEIREGDGVPRVAASLAPRPNPFNPRVVLPFDVPPEGAPVTIRIFDISGRVVRSLANGRFPSGQYQISWDGRQADGSRLGSGVYFARLEIGGSTFVQKITMLK